MIMLHSDLQKRLSDTVQRNDIFHAVIFSGPTGVGKKTLARSFAAAMHCEAPSNKPCGVCPSCIKHKTGNHPDYAELIPENGKKTISVASVRSACEELFIKPIISDRKILFIPSAQLCEAAAQNAMLKCFEEPPPYAVIMLAVNDLSALLDTIKSRAVIYNVNPVSEKKLSEFIKEKYPEKAAEAGFIAAFSGGIVGKAISLAEDGELTDKRRALLALLSSFHKSRYAALRIADALSDDAGQEEFLYELLISFLRDAAAVKFDCGNIINKDFLSDIKKFSSEVSERALVSALSSAASAKDNKSKNANYGLFITDLVLRLWEVLHD